MARGKILVTGAAGFTGRHFIDLATSQGYDCDALTQHRHDRISGAQATYCADLRDADLVATVIAECQPDYVVHLAAVAFVAHNDLNELYSSNIAGTANLLDAIIQSPQNISKTLVISSANIYGNATTLPIDETVPAAPRNDYAISKVAVEHVAALRMEHTPLLIARPFNYTGRGQGEHFLIPKLVKAFAQRTPELSLGNLDVARDFSDVRDVVSAYLQLLDSPAHSETVNVCSGSSVALRDIIARLRTMTGHDIDVRTSSEFKRANEISNLYGTDQKLRAAIGDWREFILDDTLAWMLEAYSSADPGGPQ